ncbi:MAG: preprotein translocase subunit SecA [Candidatus Pacebacteria bacterium]|nr:preprotein translocase subunit SecA [Candidatus Paceibacterota bacterium]
MSIFDTIFGDTSTKFLKKAESILAKVNNFESEVIELKDIDFPNKTKELKDRLEKGESLDDILPMAFALVREAAKRNLKERHYDVQILGGIALHSGNIVEMKTGEGKTLVATLPTYLNALTGKGVHIITVNDYLARRDAVLMGQVYNFLGLSVGVINSQNVSYQYDPTHKEEDKERDTVGEFKVIYDFLKPVSRRDAYACDITYGTNNEYGFDYLRDNLAQNKNDLVQREHNFAIVDEVDSILIDEARTPLIISQATTDSEDFYTKFSNIARQLKKDVDYTVDEKLRAITLTDEGITRAESLLGISNIYTEKGIKYVHHLETAVKARAIYEKDKDYVVQNGEVIIVDPFTGRLQPGRRWSEGIHQAIEAKEGVKIEKETRSAGSITFQNYFRFYDKLAGMTGTAITSKEEFLKVYGLDVIVVPTHRKIQRIDNPDLIFQTEKGKWKAIARKVKELNERGQPVLIGTISIEKNELLSAYLKESGVPHTILNAKNHEREGEIIAQAGRKGAVTIATNMAGRGIDIKLGGNPATKEEHEEIKELGGLFVLGTERHEARRIDNQLRGRSGRQGDPGETQFFVSLEDDLMRIFGAENIKKMMGRFGIPEDEPIQNGLITRTLEGAQAKIEGFHFDARKNTLEYDNVLNHQRNSIYNRRRKMLFADKDGIEEVLNQVRDFNAELEKIIAEKRSKLGEVSFLETVRRIALYTNDTLWMEHLEAMDYLRSSVNLRAYGQREPLVEYKKEGLMMFREMEQAFKEQVASLISNIKTDNIQINLVEEEKKEEAVYVTNENESQNSNSPKSNAPLVGRNDPCPCGSGKKYKKCHGA